MTDTRPRAATTGGRLARWSVRCSMTKHGSDWLTTSLAMCPRVFDYWKNTDRNLGKQTEEGVRANLNGNGH